MAANTRPFAMGLLCDTCRLEIYDYMELLAEKEEEIRFAFDEERIELQKEIESIRKAIASREAAIDTVSAITEVYHSNKTF